jgi:hypothetical protein
VGGYIRKKNQPLRKKNPRDIILPVIVHAFNEREEAE